MAFSLSLNGFEGSVYPGLSATNAHGKRRSISRACNFAVPTRPNLSLATELGLGHLKEEGAGTTHKGHSQGHDTEWLLAKRRRLLQRIDGSSVGLTEFLG